MNEALELAKKLAQAVPYIGRMDDSMQLANLVIERETPLRLERPVDLFVSVQCECGEAQSRANQYRINFCSYCGKPLDWSATA